MKKEDLFQILIVIGILYMLYSGFISLQNTGHQMEIDRQIEKDNIMKLASNLEQHKFMLKETKVDSLISGNMKGSFLLIGGSIYGEVNENKYLNVVYFDDDKIIDNTTGVYKITKFDLESIEIVTIPKNDTPYYKFVENGYRFCTYGDGVCNYKLKIGTPQLYLSEGWAILNN